MSAYPPVAPTATYSWSLPPAGQITIGAPVNPNVIHGPQHTHNWTASTGVDVLAILAVAVVLIAAGSIVLGLVRRYAK